MNQPVVFFQLRYKLGQFFKKKPTRLDFFWKTCCFNPVEATCTKWTTVTRHKFHKFVSNWWSQKTFIVHQKQPIMSTPSLLAASEACRSSPWSRPCCEEYTCHSACQSYNRQKHKHWSITTSPVSKHLNIQHDDTEPKYSGSTRVPF